MKLLRWAFTFPVAALAAIAVTFPLHWILYSALSGGSDPIVTPYPEMPEKFLQPPVSALVFVYFTGLIAPSSKVTIAKVALAVWCIGLTLGVFIIQGQRLGIQQILRDNYYGIPALLGILGAIVGLRALKNRLKN